MKLLPKYPIFIPSCGRYDTCMTAKFLIRDGVPFKLVVEPREHEQYAERFGAENILQLPWNNAGLPAARNWIMETALAMGAPRHWQIDDNISCIKYRYKANYRIKCDAGAALHITEDFVDRYENVPLAGLNYTTFAPRNQKAPPFRVNCHVYSCVLLDSTMPFRFRIYKNEDVDMCLQVLAAGQCTVAMNVFLAEKMATMTVKGGCTETYLSDGRLLQSDLLRRTWPRLVRVVRRFNRPHFCIAKSWTFFKTKLKLKPGVKPKDFGNALKLVAVADVKSPALKSLLQDGSSKEA
jgi:hypothetical protein